MTCWELRAQQFDESIRMQSLYLSSYLNTLFHAIDLQSTDAVGERMHPQMVKGRRPPFSLLGQQKTSIKFWLCEESDKNYQVMSSSIEIVYRNFGYCAITDQSHHETFVTSASLLCPRMHCSKMWVVFTTTCVCGQTHFPTQPEYIRLQQLVNRISCLCLSSHQKQILKYSGKTREPVYCSSWFKVLLSAVEKTQNATSK